MDEAEKLRLYERAYVASMLAIPAELLDRYPYRVENAFGLGGSMPVWRVVWRRNPPPGVDAQWEVDAAWTDIPSLFHDPGACATGA